MTEIIADWIATGIEVLLASLVIAGLVVILASTQSTSDKISEQQAVISDMKEYREYNQYDNTQVYPQDILAAIFKNRGEPAVRVKSSKGTYQWTATSSPCDYTAVAISELIEQSAVYDAVIVRNANGTVVAYEFVEHNN